MKTSLGSTGANLNLKPEEGHSMWVENGEWFTAPTVDPTKYGGHDYDEGGYERGVRNCVCGCFMGSSNSSGPVDPFGACPMNPKPETLPVKVTVETKLRRERKL